MLRLALALAFTALTGLIVPFAAAQPAEAAKVALIPFDDQVGLDPRALEDIAAGLRAAGLDESIAVVDLAPGEPDADPSRCDLACVDDLAARLGANLVLGGVVTRDPEGLHLELVLRDVGRDEPLRRVATVAVDTATLVDNTERLGRELFLALRPVAAAEPPPPRPVVRRSARDHRDVRHGRVDRRVRDVAPQYSGDRSPGLAFGLELLFPGLGLGYADDWGAVALEYAGIFGGFVLVMGSIDYEMDGGADAMGLTLGLVLVIGSRLYGIVRAPAAASEHNYRAMRAYDAARGAAFERRPLRPPEIGLSAPSFTAFALPPLSF